MNVTGQLIKVRDCERVLRKNGFTYDPISRSFFISYPYIPKDFKKDAARVQLNGWVCSTMTLIDDIKYYKNDGEFKETKKPDPRFKEYIEGLIVNNLEMSN